MLKPRKIFRHQKHTTIYQQLTTTSPQKHHTKTVIFREIPLKNAPGTTPKKYGPANRRTASFKIKRLT
jgi:hypothetical protein